MLERFLPDRKAVQDFEFEQDFPGIGHKVLALNARQLDGLQQILLGIDDVTSSKERDLGPKYQLYRDAGVKEYVAVLIEDQEVRWHRLVLK